MPNAVALLYGFPILIGMAVVAYTIYNTWQDQRLAYAHADPEYQKNETPKDEPRPPNNSDSIHRRRQSSETDTKCTICFDDVSPKGRDRKVLRCNHVFHLNCLKRWTENSEQRDCPNCRQAFTF